MILLLSTQELTENIQQNPSVVMLAGLQSKAVDSWESMRDE